MIRTHIKKEWLFTKRIIALVLCTIMVTMVIPFGSMLSTFAADGDQQEVSFVFTNKLNAGISGIEVQLTGTNGEPNITANQSGSDGKVTFTGLLEGHTYNYAIIVGVTEYIAPSNGSITVGSTNDNKGIQLFAPAPPITSQPTPNTQLLAPGTNASYTVATTATLGTPTYTWMKSGTIVGMGATLNLSDITAADAGDYKCRVSTDLSADDTYIDSNLVTLQVKGAPSISLSVNPNNNAEFASSLVIEATVSNSNGTPKGKIEFYYGSDTLIDEANLSENKASITLNPILLKSADSPYEIWAKYIAAGDETTYIDSTKEDSQKLSYTIAKATPDSTVHYAVTGTVGNNGWYVSNITITPISPFVAVGQMQSAGASTLIISTESVNGYCSFYLGDNVNFSLSTTEISEQATFIYKMDKTAPSNPTKDGGNWHWDFMNVGYPITLTSNDTISGVAKFTYSYNGGQEKEIVAEADGTAIIYLSDINRPKSYFKPKLSQLVVHSYDKAGNKSGQSVLVVDKEIELSYDNQYLTHTVDSSNQDVASDSINSSTRFIYNSPTTVTITADADGFTSESAIVTLNGENQNLTWETADNKIFTTNLELQEGNNQISIAAAGYVITSNEIEYHLNNDSYTSNIHTVDITDPIIIVSYDPATALPNANIFVTDRTMTVSIEDKNFRPNEFTFTNFTATDCEGTSLNNVVELEDNLLTALKNATWTVMGDLHSASITFSIEANYAFTLGYQDLANNPTSYTEPTFTIDKTAPTNLKVKYHTNPISTLVSVLTFGFYKPSVTVELNADDATSGVEYFNWTYTQEDGTSTTLNVPIETAKLNASSTGKTATAQFTLTADDFKQYRGTINFIASDKAGNVSATYNGPMFDSTDDSKSVDVLVVDTIAPTSVVTFTEPTQIRNKDTMALYTGDKAVYANVEGASSILYYTTSVTATIIITEANFYEEDVKVKINGDEYTVSDWTQTLDTDLWTGTITISDAGNYVVTVEYTDKSDNVMTSYQSSKIFIDGTAPTIEKIDFVLATSDDVTNTTKFINKLEYGFYFKKAFIANIIVSDSDPSSGLDNISYRLVPYENGVKQTETAGIATITDGVARISIPAGFKGQIFAEAFDNTRNTSDEKTTQAYVIDDTAPDISVVNNNTTIYTDVAGNKLYVTDTSVTVTITDTISGIKEIGYSQSSEKDTFTRKNIELENTGYSVGYNLDDGWSVDAMDENLVTKVTKTFLYSSDDNDIILTFDATDRSGNQTQNINSDKITVDKTAPIINFTFRADDDTDVYYNANRIADISVIERNFNATLIKAAIENKFGNIPSFTFTEISNTEHTAVIDFDEGDYTLAMSGTDMGNHNATVNYNGGNEKLFYVDKTKPVIEENFTTFSNGATQNSFNIDKTATIKVTEHNFDPALINLRITRKGAGQEHNTTGLADVTQQLLNGVNWVNNGDVHTITFSVTADAVYQIEIAPSDLAGNASDNRNTVVFEIDKTAPVLSVIEDRKANVYVKPASEEPSATVTFEDNNIKEIKYVITSYNFNKKENGGYEFVVVKGVDSTVQGATVDLPAEYFEKDGIYEIKANAYDYAGNDSGEMMCTYVVMRNTAVHAYISETDLEKFDNIGTRAMDFDDIPINIYIANEAEITLKIGDTLLSNGDYKVISQKAFLNSVDEYQLVIPQSYISRMFNEDQQVYDMPLNILNDSGNLLTLGRLVVDNVKPFGEFEDGIMGGKGYYNVSSKEVQIIRISDDIDENTTKVIVNGQEVNFVYDADSKTISFTLEKSPAYGHPWAGYDIKVTLFDTAGNEYALFEINNVYVGNWFYRFWFFFTMGALAIIVGGLLWWKPWRKKEED